MTITYPEFLETVNQNAGEVLLTSGEGAKFRLEQSDSRIIFTPLSSGKSRKLNQEMVQRYLDIFNATQSTTTSHYTDKMYNGSYVLAIIKLWIAQRSDAPLIDDQTGDVVIDPDFSASEGDMKIRSHRQRERRRDLVIMAKALFRSAHDNRLFCKACGFDFGKTYGEPDFIEAHHKTPLRDLEVGAKTRLSDLAMVCANCHRMLHRGTPWLTLDELKSRMAVAASKKA